MYCQQPPWGQLTAVNVNTGEFAWRVPLGITESLPPDKQSTGRPGNGGTIATAGGLVFVGATDDGRFRAFDAKIGKELWTFKLPGVAQATPMTYEGRDGRQYVVITATGGGFFGKPVTDDSVIAFALAPTYCCTTASQTRIRVESQLSRAAVIEGARPGGDDARHVGIDFTADAFPGGRAADAFQAREHLRRRHAETGEIYESRPSSAGAGTRAA